ncbi:MAG: gfo/Idh/MocA family oxidoreductase, partial [Angelakisella sp.]
GADMEDGLRINGVKHNRQYVEIPKLVAGEVDFFSGGGVAPEVMEQQVFVNAVLGKGELCVLPEQAAAVTRILDAIYESAKTGKPVYFN